MVGGESEEMKRAMILALLVGCSSAAVPSLGPPTIAGGVSRDSQNEDAPWSERWIGGASGEDIRRYIRPLLEREGIPYTARFKDLGLIEFGTDSPAHARRARALLLQDAMEKRYYFISKDGIVGSN